MTQRDKASQKERTIEVELEENRSAKDRFLDLVNNRGKFEKSGVSQIRESGFICLVRVAGDEAPSLKGLQDLVHGSEQHWNRCYSLRYRIEAPNGFGTLVYALMRDLSALQEPVFDQNQILGLPGAIPAGTPSPTEYGFEDFAQRLRTMAMRVASPTEGSVGEFSLDEALLANLFGLFALEDVLGTGERFLVFCEFEETAEPETWGRLFAFLKEKAPERFGFIFSGYPGEQSDKTDGVGTVEIAFAADDPLVAPQSQEPSAQLFQISGLSSDRPSGRDDLGVHRYAESLARFILHPDTQPLTIGIHGPWGKGKSSFMGFIEQELVREACPRTESDPLTRLQKRDQDLIENQEALALAQGRLRDADDEARKEAAEAVVRSLQAEREKQLDARQAAWKEVVKRSESRVVCANFNAWRFEDSKQIWAGLASIIIDRFEENLTRFEKLRLRLTYIWRARRVEARQAAIEIGLAGIIALALLLFMGSGEAAALAGKDAFSKILLTIAGPLAIFLLVAWRLHGLIRPLGQRVLEYAQLPDYKEQRGFQHKVLDDIRAVADTLRRFKRADPKIVIFIDDLDRCSDAKIMEILQAINLVLAESRFYVVMGVDTEMLFRAIQSHYKKAHGSEPDPDNFARRYLRKIIQLSFHLPDAGEAQRFSFIDSLFSATARGVAPVQAQPGQDGKQEAGQEAALPPLPIDLSTLREVDPVPLEQVTDTPAELEAFKAFADFIEDNARETKRLVNVHRLVKILLQEANQGWSETRQRRLVRWLVFCSAWPGMIDEALGYASRTPDAEDIFTLSLASEPYPLAPWINGQDEALEDFARNPRGAPIPAEALTQDRALFLAAKIAELVQDRGAMTSDEEDAEATEPLPLTPPRLRRLARSGRAQSTRTAP